MLVTRVNPRSVSVVLMLLAAPAQAEPRVSWEVTNPFRLFLDGADTEVHRATWASLSEREKRSPVLAAERLLSERHPDGWAATMFHKTCWDAFTNRYTCPDRIDYLAPKSHKVRARIDGVGDAQTVDCTWLTAPQGKPAQARWIWDWLESGDNVKAYPEIVFGHKPGYPKSTTDLLPRRISSIGQAQLSYDLDTVRYGAGNLSVDMWLTSSDKPAQFAAPPITHEIMIWLEHFGPMYAGGKLQEHAVIDGVPYRVYLGDNFGQGWRYVAFLPSIPLRKQARMNLVAYFDYLKSKGWVSGDEYLSAVNIGNEIISGKGETRVRALSIDIGASPSPTPATSSPSGTQTTSAIATRP